MCPCVCVRVYYIICLAPCVRSLNKVPITILGFVFFDAKMTQVRALTMDDMVWCGVVWCGVVWCGVVWCGVV